MTTWSQDFTVKSNARRAARKLKADPAKVQAFVKAGKTLYRFPMPGAAKPTPDFQDSGKTGGKGKWKSAAQKKREAKAAKPAKAAPSKAPAKAKAPKAAPASKPAGAPQEAPKTVSDIPRGGKFDAVAQLLRRPGGASMTEVTTATGWKPHSARARISVDVAKLLGKGETIERRREGGESHYAIVPSKQLDLPIAEPKAA